MAFRIWRMDPKGGDCLSALCGLAMCPTLLREAFKRLAGWPGCRQAIAAAGCALFVPVCMCAGVCVWVWVASRGVLTWSRAVCHFQCMMAHHAVISAGVPFSVHDGTPRCDECWGAIFSA